ncbi:DUF4141 domain-containing protein [Alistipes ihumii]|uniref:DUF4141 domain-containing protein n=1 Tax=Alistipes ihumii TaxID=1470347 RepID=UPI0039954AA9
MAIAACGLLFAGKAQAQWVVTDPSNLAQSIVNSVNEIVETSATAERMLANFQETVKIYEQGKEYYDKLKAVHNLVQDARKVQQSVLLLGEISDIYVNNYGRMLSDKNYTAQELSAIAFGYNRIMQQGSEAILELKNVINPTGMSMTDKERLDLVERVYNEMVRYRNLCDYYTRKNIAVSYYRAQKAGQTQQIMRLYGNSEQRHW